MIRPFARRASSRSATLAGLVLCTAVPVLVCGSGSSAAAVPTTTGPARPAPTTTQVPSDIAQKVIAGYRGMWADLVSAARTSDYQSARLPRHASGDALNLLVQGLAKDQVLGIVTRGKPVLQPHITSLSPSGNPTKATITDCFDNTHWIEYKTSGGLEKNAPGGRRSTTADLVRMGRTWKVSQLTIRATGTC
jgi:hypothetical protein